MSTYKHLIAEIVDQVFDRANANLEHSAREIALERRVSASQAKSEFGLTDTQMRRLPNILPYTLDDQGGHKRYKVRDILSWLDSLEVQTRKRNNYAA